MLTAGTPLIFGRRTEKCNVLFKNETKGISSIHCKVKWYNGKVLIKDLGSTYGTWLNEEHAWNQTNIMNCQIREYFILDQGKICFYGDEVRSRRGKMEKIHIAYKEIPD